MLRLKTFLILMFALPYLPTAFASEEPIRVDGTTPGYVHYEKPDLAQGQAIQYLHYSLSNRAKAWLAEHIDAPFDSTLLKSSTVTSQANLGMNNVPVPNQGVHGSCVTFALAGAIDAIVGHTNYISELCNLSLGSYLADQHHGYPSGWNGSTASTVFSQIKSYGINSFDTQIRYGCAGVRKYPANNINNNGNAMSSDEFGAHSEMIMNTITYKPIRRLDEALSDTITVPAFIDNIKTAINTGHRVVIAFLLDNDSKNGAHGTYHAKNDSWVITEKTIQKAKRNMLLTGHEVIITGYDDNAVINGPDCSFHRGVFTLRNSWGKNAGDKGEYYMSYDYLSKLALDMYELIPIN